MYFNGVSWMPTYPTHRPTPEILCDVCESFVVGEVRSFKDSLVCRQCYTDLTGHEQHAVRQMPNVPWPALVSVLLIVVTLAAVGSFWPLVQGLLGLIAVGVIFLATLKILGGMRG